MIKAHGHEMVDIGYLAGLIDGEGCITIQKNAMRTKGNYSYSLRIAIGMQDVKTIKYIHELFGGNFYCDKNRGCGETNRWYCSGDDVGEILKLIVPYLHEKKTQAELALDYLEVVGAGRSGYERPLLEKELQELYHIKMKILKT